MSPKDRLDRMHQALLSADEGYNPYRSYLDSYQVINEDYNVLLKELEILDLCWSYLRNEPLSVKGKERLKEWLEK